ncbi:MAG: 30S ribosome-binding factor RbfA [Gemmatimonadales bacterium]|jgi:ribosome-binding factor A
MAREYTRTQRVAQLLKEEISRLLQREVKDARIGLVTVTDVRVTRDLKYADVYVYLSGDEERRAKALEGLTSAAGFMRTRLGRELTIRRMPELRFVLDRTQDHATRIHELLSELGPIEQSDEGEDGQ